MNHQVLITSRHASRRSAISISKTTLIILSKRSKTAINSVHREFDFKVNWTRQQQQTKSFANEFPICYESSI